MSLLGFLWCHWCRLLFCTSEVCFAPADSVLLVVLMISVTKWNQIETTSSPCSITGSMEALFLTFLSPLGLNAHLFKWTLKLCRTVSVCPVDCLHPVPLTVWKHTLFIKHCFPVTHPLSADILCRVANVITTTKKKSEKNTFGHSRRACSSHQSSMCFVSLCPWARYWRTFCSLKANRF